MSILSIPLFRQRLQTRHAFAANTQMPKNSTIDEIVAQLTELKDTGSSTKAQELRSRIQQAIDKLLNEETVAGEESESPTVFGISRS
jgi:hypothetical protein